MDDSTTYTLDGQETTFSGLKVGHTINATLKTVGEAYLSGEHPNISEAMNQKVKP